MNFGGVLKSTGDKGLDIVRARRARAGMIVMVMALGLVACLVFYGGDVYFTYLPLEPIVGSVIAMAAAIVTTPIQIAGTAMLGDRATRDNFREEDVVAYYIMWGSWVVANIGDVLSNIWGLFYAMERGARPDLIGMVTVVFFGVLFAFIENIAQVLVFVFGKNRSVFDQMTEAMKGKVSSRLSRSSRNTSELGGPSMPPGMSRTVV